MEAVKSLMTEREELFHLSQEEAPAAENICSRTPNRLQAGATSLARECQLNSPQLASYLGLCF